MDPASRVDGILDRLSGTSDKRVLVYAHGVAEKWRHVLYTVDRIKKLNASPPFEFVRGTAGGQSGPGLLDQEAEIRYFCDTLWTSLHSVLDILAQLINALSGNALTEENTDFASIVNHLNQSQSGSQLQRRMDALKRSKAYGLLHAFRRCATHRRPVYIEALTIQASGTPGYQTATSASSVVRRLICDDPLALTPAVSKQRELVPFAETVVKAITERLDRVLIAVKALT